MNKYRKFTNIPYESKQAIYMTLLSGGFWMAWGIGIFVTPYFQTIGFNATRMGLINSCCAGVGIIAMSLWGIFSDKIRSIRKIVVILLTGNAIFYSLTPFLKGWFGLVFWPYFILCPVYAIFRSPSSSSQDPPSSARSSPARGS